MRSLRRFFIPLVSAVTVCLSGTGHTQSILMSSNSGSGLLGLGSGSPLTYNFGITTAGAEQGLAFTNIGVYINRGSRATESFTVQIFNGLGGATGGNTLLTNYSVAASNINQGSLALFNLLLTNSILFTNGNYSLQLSTEAASGNTGFNLRQGTLSLVSSDGSPLPTSLWVEDTNATGTAGTNIQAAFVLADYQVTTTNVNFGNYRVGTELTTNVTLTNTAPPAVNSTNGNVAEQLSAVASASNAATVTGLSTDLLARAATTNFSVGLSTANVGTNSGTVSLAYTSLTNGTASSRAGGATNVGSQTIAVTGVGFRMADEELSTTNVNLGRFHIGATNLTGSLGITNTAANDGFSEGLAVANDGTTGGATVGGLPGGLIGAGGNTNISVGLGSISAVGTNSGTVTLGFQSSGTGTSGLAATNIGSQIVNIIAQGYSGQAIWSTSAGGSWNNFDNWDVPGGTPGIDGVLSTNDTATFGNAISTARTVSLNGQSPVLTTMTFSNAAASYTIAQGSGGAITLGTEQGAGLITNAAGNHTVSAAIGLARTTTVGVATDSRLGLGAVNGAQDLSKTGAGTLSITDTGNLSGATTVAAGTLQVDGSIADSAVTVESGAVLSGSGTVGGIVLNLGSTISPGNSPGTLTVDGDAFWNAGANYNWQIHDATGVAGSPTGWDLINVTGVLDLTALSIGSEFNINLWSLAEVGPDVDGPALNFDPTQNYTWMILSASNGITGFSADKFNINTAAINGTAGFANALAGGAFSMLQSGNDLNLVFTAGSGPGPEPIPEPGTWVAAALLLGGAAYLRWRRRRVSA